MQSKRGRITSAKSTGDLPNLVKEEFGQSKKLFYLTVLAALSVCTNSIPLQGAGCSIAAGIHTFLQMEKNGKGSQAEKANIRQVEQK